MGKFAIKKTNTGYTISLKAGCKNGIASVVKNAPDAEVIEPEE